MTVRRLRQSRLLTFALPVAAVLLFAASVAFGHVRLDHAEPKVGSTVDAPPAEVKITFSDDVDFAGTTIRVSNASGKRVDKDDVHLDAKDKSVAIVSLPDKLPAGKYKVVWNALCEDGHKTKGTFNFEVAPNSN